MTPKLPWTTPRLVEAPLTREGLIELVLEEVRHRGRREGRSEFEVALLGELCRAFAALREIAAFPCRRLALRKERQGWDCQQLGAPLCESCIAAEAIRGGTGERPDRQPEPEEEEPGETLGTWVRDEEGEYVQEQAETLPGLDLEEDDTARRLRWETGEGR